MGFIPMLSLTGETIQLHIDVLCQDSIADAMVADVEPVLNCPEYDVKLLVKLYTYEKLF